LSFHPSFELREEDASISAIFFEKDLKTTPLPSYSRGNQLAGLAIFSVVTVAMRGI